MILTNQRLPVTAEITYLPFSNGQRICNILEAWDCLIVENGGIMVLLEEGESKIYVLEKNDEED